MTDSYGFLGAEFGIILYFLVVLQFHVVENWTF